MLVTALVLSVSVLAGIFVLDRAMAPTLRWIAPWLPSDFVGPDGWLLDTRRKLGVFDRRLR